MARKIITAEIEADGEKRTIFYRKPSGRFGLTVSDNQKAGELTNTLFARNLFLDCLVKDEAGVALGAKEVDALFDEDFEFLTKLQELLTASLPKSQAADAGKA